jgi:hypothetical protein
MRLAHPMIATGIRVMAYMTRVLKMFLDNSLCALIRLNEFYYSWILAACIFQHARLNKNHENCSFIFASSTTSSALINIRDCKISTLELYDSANSHRCPSLPSTGSGVFSEFQLTLMTARFDGLESIIGWVVVCGGKIESEQAVARPLRGLASPSWSDRWCRERSLKAG